MSRTEVVTGVQTWRIFAAFVVLVLMVSAGLVCDGMRFEAARGDAAGSIRDPAGASLGAALGARDDLRHQPSIREEALSVTPSRTAVRWPRDERAAFDGAPGLWRLRSTGPAALPAADRGRAGVPLSGLYPGAEGTAGPPLRLRCFRFPWLQRCRDVTPETRPKPPGPALKPCVTVVCQVDAIWTEGGYEWELGYMHQIVECESRWQPSATGKYGEAGLFQIHPVNWALFHGRDPWDVTANTEVALTMRKASGWGPWSCAH